MLFSYYNPFSASPIRRDARAPVNRFGLQGSPGTAYGPAPVVMPPTTDSFSE